MNDDIMFFVLGWYLLILPLVTNMMWQESKDTFVKFYFTKSERVNFLGFTVFLILCSGSWLWYLLFMFLTLIFYVVVVPFIWVFEFLFLNKDCSNIKNIELQDKLNGEKDVKDANEFR
jgi:hypothetical protein